MLNIKLYRQFLQEYVSEAVRTSNGSVFSIRENLDAMQVGRWLVKHRAERLRALEDARTAFEKNRHWPLEIILSQLGVEVTVSPRKP